MKRIIFSTLISVYSVIGFSQSYNVVPFSGTNNITTDTGTVYDHAGTSNYSNNANGTLTILPETAGKYITLTFISCDVEPCCDHLLIYDGTSTSATLLGSSSGSMTTSSFTASSSSGALTLKFTSDGSTVSTGFEAKIATTSTIPSSDLVITTPTVSTINIFPSSSINIWYYLKNQGIVSSGYSYTGFYLSKDSILDSSDVFITSQSNYTLGSNLSYYYSNAISIPSGSTVGNYYILFRSDYNSIITESNENNNVSSVPITINAPNYDLSPSDLSIQNTTLSPGASFYLSNYSNNYGTSYLASSSEGFYLSKDLKFDTSDVFLGSSIQSGIYPNDYNYITSTLSIPSQTIAGDYFILVYEDYTKSIAESNENNNINAIGISISTNNSDLQLITSSIYSSYSASLAAGNQIELVNTILNAGNQSVTSSIGFYLSTDSLIDANDVYLSSYSSSTYYSNSIATNYSPILTIPQSTALGTYYILSKIDYLNTLSESNENNNTSVVPIKVVAPSIDLSIQNQTISQSTLVIGSTYSLSCYISNTGSSTSAYSNVGFYLSTDSIFDLNDTYLGYYSGGTLLSGGSSYRGTSITIPSTVANGKYYVLYYADYSNQVNETSETNNIAVIPIMIKLASSDIAISNPQAPTSIQAGNNVSLRCTILNNGTNYLSYFYTGFYLSKDTVFDANDVYLSAITTSGISAGNSSILTSNVTIPSTTTVGQYYILYYVDYTNQITESNELNNLSYTALNITNTSGDNFSIPVSGSNTITTCSGMLYDDGINSNYSNNANGTITINPQTVGNYMSISFQSFSTESSYDQLSIYDGQSTSSPLIGRYSGSNSPGKIFATNSTGALTLNFTSDGTRNYSGFAAQLLCETSIPKADLAFDSTTYNSLYSVVPGTQFTYNYTLLNTGAYSVPSYTVGYYLSTDSILDKNDIFIDNYTSSYSLSSGSSTIITDYITIPTSVKTGNYYLIAYADYTNAITEQNELNNYKVSPIKVESPFIDLLFPTISPITSNIFSGSSFYCSYSIKNGGNTTVSNPSVGYYLSNDSIWDVGDTFLANTNEYSLSGNDSFNESILLTIPTTITTGTYYIILYADYLNLINESNKLNNTKSIKINVQIPIVDLSIISQNLSSGSIGIGQNITANTYILNTGNSSVSSTKIGYYLSTDSVWDISDVYLNSSSLSTISANGYLGSTLSIAIPTTTTAGNYYIIYFADYLNSIIETNENNNKSFNRITIVNPSVDLQIIGAISNSNTPFSGSNLLVHSTIFNVGNSSASSSNIGYYLSTDSLLDANDIYLNYSYGYSLSKMIGSTITGYITIPTSTSTGNYYVLFVADYSNIVTESNELNNVAFTPITVISSSFDISSTITNISTSSISPGSNVTIYDRINNNGNTSANNSYVGYYLSTDSILSTNDIYLTSLSSGIISVGSNVTQSLALTIPTSTISGNYYIICKADYANMITESDELNNISYRPITVISPLADLSISSVYTNSSFNAGSTGSVSYIINNLGGLTGNASSVGLYLSKNNYLDTNDVLIGNYYEGLLNGNTNASKNTSITIPLSTATGSYYIIVAADYTNAVVESNENNNYSIYSIYVYGSNIDLQVNSIGVGQNVTANGFCRVSCNYVNNGTNKSDSSRIGYYLSKNTTLDTSDIFLGDLPISLLNANSTLQTLNNLLIPSTVTTDSYYLLVIADYLGYVTESNEINNIAYVSLNVSGVNDIATIDECTFHLFPNPANSKITFTQNADSKILMNSFDIVSSIGQTVLQNIENRENSQTIDISQLPSGIYFLKIRTDSKVYVQRFIKQ